LGYPEAETDSGEKLRIRREAEFDGNLIDIVLSVKSTEGCFKLTKEGWMGKLGYFFFIKTFGQII